MHVILVSICLDTNEKKKKKIISLFNLFLQLFMSSTTFFYTIYESYCTISSNFYFYLQYFK